MDYVISNEVLGRGGMGVVLRGRHRSLNREVAVKVLSSELAGDSEFVERFMREARISARIQHPNVVTVYDAGRDENGRPYLVMEILSGETLRERMKRAPIPAGEATAIAVEVLKALSAAHKDGIFHRDVKPGNIFITQSGVVKLMDFGIATALSESRLTSTGGFIGTAEYMSPEQVQGKAIDGRADLYSLGIVLMEMLSGKVPFSGDTLSILHRQVHDPVPPLRGIPDQTNNILQRFLAKRPEDRFQTADEAIEALLGRRAVSAPPPATALIGKNPIALPLAIAGAVALVLIVALAASGSGKATPAVNPSDVPVADSSTPDKATTVSPKDRTPDPKKVLLEVETGYLQAKTAADNAAEAQRAMANATSNQDQAKWQKQMDANAAEAARFAQETISKSLQARKDGIDVASVTLAGLYCCEAISLMTQEKDCSEAIKATQRYLDEPGHKAQDGLSPTAAKSRETAVRSSLKILQSITSKV